MGREESCDLGLSRGQAGSYLRLAFSDHQPLSAQPLSFSFSAECASFSRNLFSPPSRLPTMGLIRPATPGFLVTLKTPVHFAYLVEAFVHRRLLEVRAKARERVVRKQLTFRLKPGVSSTMSGCA